MTDHPKIAIVAIICMKENFYPLYHALQQVKMTFLTPLENLLTLQLAGETLALNLGFDIIVWRLSRETSHWTV